MNKTYEYRNRYNDNIVFVEEEPNVVYMYGGKFMRWGCNEESPDHINMVDPSGGPYIEIGNDLLGPWKGKNIIKIEKAEKVPEEENEMVIKFTLE